jgi:hypothetical protein
MLYEGVSARPTTIPLAEVRESVSGQPMFGCGSFASVWSHHGDFRHTPMNGRSQDRPACLKGANT